MLPLLLIDNYDSFTYNLYHSFMKWDTEVSVVRNDDPILLDRTFISSFKGIIISPGPSNPSHSGYCFQVLESWAGKKPIFGVCLGMQIINEFYGGKTIPGPEIVHGKSSVIDIVYHQGIFRNFGDQLRVARYHSLICADLSDEFIISAHYRQIPMAMEHRQYRLFSVQFHPESFLTEKGDQLIQNVIRNVSYESD